MEKGFIQFIIVLIIFLVILSVLGVNLRAVFQHPLVRDNFSFLYNAAKDIWDGYLKEPAEYLWDVFKTYLWDSFIENMRRIKEGGSPEIVD